MSKEVKDKKSFKREVAAPSLMEALQHLDDMQRSFYDMYVLEVTKYEEREGYVAITVFSWENQETRELYSC